MMSRDTFGTRSSLKLFLIGFLTAITLMAVNSFAISSFPNGRQSILKEGIRFYGARDEVMLLPFSCQGKFGFTGRMSTLNVIIEPIFDDIYNTDYALVPVKMNGEWGAVDVSGNTLPSKQPAIPCVYDLIEVCDDEHVYASKNGVKTKLDIMDFRNN
jgi:hypothetical protein